MPPNPPAQDDEQIARCLIQARRSGHLADANAVQIADTAQAYRVQALVAQAMGWCVEDAPQVWKSGGAGREAVLTHALLAPAGVWSSPAAAGGWPLQMRGIEAEVALRLGCAVDAALARRLDHASAPALLDAMTVSIEMVDTRWAQGLSVSPCHKTADAQVHGALVLGRWVPYTPRDWARQCCEVRLGGQVWSFTGSHALGDPAWLLPQWLRHVTRDGSVLPAGSVVSTGTWCGLLQARPGDEVVVAFEGIGQARVRL